MTMQGTTAGHNLANINAAVIDGFAKRLNIETQIAALKATHIKPLQEDLSEVVKDQKKESGIDGKDLAIFYAAYKRQQEAKAFVDDDDRDRVLENMRIVFEAMQQGGQLDFIDAVTTTPSDGTDDAPDNVTQLQPGDGDQNVGTEDAGDEANAGSKEADEGPLGEESPTQGAA